MLEKVVKFVEKEGHGYIPQRCKDDPELGVWCKNRRSEKRRGILSASKEEKLDKAGFVWSLKNKKI